MTCARLPNLAAGGFSEISAPWPTATMGTPNAPTAARASITGSEGASELELTWRTPDWGGGYPLSHYVLIVERFTGVRRARLES